MFNKYLDFWLSATLKQYFYQLTKKESSFNLIVLIMINVWTPL